MQTLKRYAIHLRGLSPIIMNCDRLANPLDPQKKKLSELTSIKKKMDEHYLAMSKIEWQARMYFDDDLGLYISSKMIAGCFRASARKEKKGMLMKAVIIDCMPGTPIIQYKNKTQEELWALINKKGEHVHAFIESVNVQRAKTMRTRPIFHNWEIKFELLLNVELLSERELELIIKRAGFDFGMGDCRPELATGIFGRFNLESMVELKEN